MAGCSASGCAVHAAAEPVCTTSTLLATTEMNKLSVGVLLLLTVASIDVAAQRACKCRC
jgi:hypothetical protein